MIGEMIYVELTEEEKDLRDIDPGELHEPIDMDWVNARIGPTYLPATETPPLDEDWTTGIFGCSEDRDSCLTGLFCPCVLFGRNCATLNEETSSQRACVCHAVFIEGPITLAALTPMFSGYIDPRILSILAVCFVFGWWLNCAIYTGGLGRQPLQTKYHLKDSPCDPLTVHCCLHWCAICQEHREMQHYLAKNASSRDTIVDPPQVQEMNSGKHDHGSSSPSPSRSDDDENNNLQLQPV